MPLWHFLCRITSSFVKVGGRSKIRENSYQQRTPKEVYKMNKPTTEKEKLLMIFSEMNDQLAELESILKKSFSDLHKDLIREEEDRLSLSETRISLLEKNLAQEEVFMDEKTKYPLGKNQSVGLKFELGFN
jgi:predicted RNase H-like nuclease (RuvC/YqgF family)